MLHVHTSAFSHPLKRGMWVPVPVPNHLETSGSTPTVAVIGGIGGPSGITAQPTIVGNDSAGTIVCVAAVSINNGLLVTVTFAQAWIATPSIIVHAVVGGGQQCNVTAQGTGSFNIAVIGIAAPLLGLTINYHCLGCPR